MKQFFVIIDADGLAESAGYGYPPEGAIITDGAEGIDAMNRLYVDGANGLVPRPVIPAPVLEGDTVTVASLPEGSLVRVEDLTGMEQMLSHTAGADDTGLTLTLPDAGRYYILIEPPLPYLGAELEFEI